MIAWIRISSLAVLLSLVSTAQCADIYAIARRSYSNSPFFAYLFGRFDIDNPDTSGGAGNYVYNFSFLGPESTTAISNLAFDTTSSTMYLVYSFAQYRSISGIGILSGDLGATDSTYGMTYDDSGNLIGTDLANLLQLNPANGATTASATLSPAGSIYSSFGGNMAWASNTIYYANEADYNLVTLGIDGTVTTVGAFSGTGYDNTQAHVLFMHSNQMYMLNGLNLYTLNLATAALTKLGSITNVGGNQPSPGFAGAISMTPVPEPSTFVLAAAAGCVAAIGHRLRRASKAARNP